MKRCSLLLLAASSLCALALAETRPHYGGTVRIVLHETPQSLEPATLTGPSLSSLSRQIFETLVVLDDRGRPQPLLATSWQAEPGNQRWHFILRSGVFFHDGAALDATAVAASLRMSNPGWRVTPSGNAVMIETDAPDPQLPVELALSRNGIAHRAGAQLNGTGPFVSKFDSGKHLTLIANDQYWGGRPFLDSVEVDFGVSDRDSTIGLDLGKADVVQVPPENIQRARAQNRTVATSEPGVLIALVFASEPRSDFEAHIRTVMTQSLDVSAINDVVFQGGGEPAGALLPNWLSGFAFLFHPGPHERTQRTEAYVPALTLGYDSSDPVARIIAERILLNARDAGLTLQVTTGATADVRLTRLPLVSSDVHLALIELAKALQLRVPKFNTGSIDELYAAEQSLLQSNRVIPLLHVRNAVALRANIRDWSMFPDGTWNLANVWLAPERP